MDETPNERPLDGPTRDEPLGGCPTPELCREVGACVEEEGCAEWRAELLRRARLKDSPAPQAP